MASPAFEVAEVFRRHGDAYRREHAGHLGRVERRVTSAIEVCRTAALGGHVEACDACGTTRIAYSSCRKLLRRRRMRRNLIAYCSSPRKASFQSPSLVRPSAAATGTEMPGVFGHHEAR